MRCRRYRSKVIDVNTNESLKQTTYKCFMEKERSPTEYMLPCKKKAALFSIRYILKLYNIDDMCKNRSSYLPLALHEIDMAEICKRIIS